MPFATFEPSDAGARHVEQFQSLMDRAVQRRAAEQEIEQRKERFVTERILDDQQIQLNRARLAQMEGETRVRAAKSRADVAIADGTYRAATIAASQLEQNSTLLQRAADELPDVVARIDAASSPAEVRTIVAEFHGKYSHIAKDPVLGQHYASIENQVAGRLTARSEEYQTKIQAAVEALLPALDAADPQTLAQVRRSPFYAVARLNPEFAKAADAAMKTAAEHELRAREEAQKQRGAVELERVKTETGRKEAPQFLIEKAMKIDQSAKDLDDLEKLFGDMTTGPFVGFFRGLNPYDTDAKALEAKLKATVPNLARGVFAEVGVLTDADIQNYMATLPNLKSPKDRAAKLVEMLRDVLERQRSNLNGVLQGQGYKTGGIPGFEQRQPVPGSQIQAIARGL